MKLRDEDDDDDVFESTEDSTVSSVASVDAKRRSQSLSALTNDVCSSQVADVAVSHINGSLLLSS